MKNTTQMTIAWIGKSVGEDEFVIVHSSEITQEAVNEAARRFQAGQFVDGFVPIVFLDPALDSAETRGMLESQAGHRFWEWLRNRKGR